MDKDREKQVNVATLREEMRWALLNYDVNRAQRCYTKINSASVDTVPFLTEIAESLVQQGWIPPNPDHPLADMPGVFDVSVYTHVFHVL